MDKTSIMRRRVVADIGTPGHFVHQAWFPGVRVWADIGDPKPTRQEAEQAMDAAIERENP